MKLRSRGITALGTSSTADLSERSHSSPTAAQDGGGDPVSSHLAPGLPNGRVFTLRKIWYLSRNSLSSFLEVVVIL
jgi:hypothetical protein